MTHSLLPYKIISNIFGLINKTFHLQKNPPPILPLLTNIKPILLRHLNQIFIHNKLHSSQKIITRNILIIQLDHTNISLFHLKSKFIIPNRTLSSFMTNMSLLRLSINLNYSIGIHFAEPVSIFFKFSTNHLNIQNVAHYNFKSVYNNDRSRKHVLTFRRT